MGHPSTSHHLLLEIADCSSVAPHLQDLIENMTIPPESTLAIPIYAYIPSKYLPKMVKTSKQTEAQGILIIDYYPIYSHSVSIKTQNVPHILCGNLT